MISAILSTSPDTFDFTLVCSLYFGSLSITDNGCGMNPDEVSRMFKAFYSTKPEKGTGLGLATVEKIVTMYGGKIKVNSTPGTGAEIVLLFDSADKS